MVGVVIAGVVLVAGSTGVVVSTHDYHCHTIIATTTDHYIHDHPLRLRLLLPILLPLPRLPLLLRLLLMLLLLLPLLLLLLLLPHHPE